MPEYISKLDKYWTNVQANRAHQKCNELLEEDVFYLELYQKLRSLIYRCYYTDGKLYPHYGAKGTEICDRWLNNPETFKEDMHSTYFQDALLARHRVEEDYSPENCYWATRSELSSNSHNAQRFKIEGKEYTIYGLLKVWGHPWVSYNTAYVRIKRGWDPLKAVSTPPRNYTK